MTIKHYRESFISHANALRRYLVEPSSNDWWSKRITLTDQLESIKTQCFPDSAVWRRVKDTPAFLFREFTAESIANEQSLNTTLKESIEGLFSGGVCKLLCLLTSEPPFCGAQSSTTRVNVLKPTIDRFGVVPKYDEPDVQMLIEPLDQWMVFMQNTLDYGLPKTKGAAGRPNKTEQYITIYFHHRAAEFTKAELQHRYAFKTRRCLNRAIRLGRGRFEQLPPDTQQKRWAEYSEIYGIPIASPETR